MRQIVDCRTEIGGEKIDARLIWAPARQFDGKLKVFFIQLELIHSSR